MRALTMLNERGDTTISWTPDRDDEMEALIEKKMQEGVTFFIIADRGLRWPLKEAGDAKHHRHLAIPDEDFRKFVEAGQAAGTSDAVPTPSEPVKSVRKAKTAKEVATGHSVGVRQRRGG